MTTAVNVARYIINYSHESGVPINNLRLQSLLYLVQGQFLNTEGCMPFEDEILAGGFGPFVSSVFNEYKSFGKCNIPKVELYVDMSKGIWRSKIVKYCPEIIRRVEQDVIRDVVDACSNFTDSGIQSSICSDHTPYVRAYSAGENSVIDKATIRDFFKK